MKALGPMLRVFFRRWEYQKLKLRMTNDTLILRRVIRQGLLTSKGVKKHSNQGLINQLFKKSGKKDKNHYLPLQSTLYRGLAFS